MLFNSVEFAIFLPIVYILYWFFFNKKKPNYRNAFLLAVSYFFYGSWDWRFLSLIFISSATDFFLANAINATDPENKKKRKLFLLISLTTNLGILGFFKYYNFFIDSFISTFSYFGSSFSYQPLKIILPVGISFYTFQSLSYTLDVFFRKMQPTKNIINYLAFVSFFPQLVAGPIERASKLLPQFDDLKKFNYQETRTGLLLIVFGLFKKIMIADRLAVFVNQTYNNPTNAEGLPMLLGISFFAIQLYLDFSAYSDIAIGTARIFGFQLSVNFKRPYLATSFSDFWRRWHITLSSWFRDYIYIPLGGNRINITRTHTNTLIVFLLSGLWHGASWNFVIWGLLNALFLILFDRFFNKNKKSIFNRFTSSFITTVFWTFSLIFFRALGFDQALEVFGNLGLSNAEAIFNFGLLKSEFQFSLYLIIGMFIFEILTEMKGENLSVSFYKKPTIIRWSFYLILVLSIVYLGFYGSAADNSFIYFQF